MSSPSTRMVSRCATIAAWASRTVGFRYSANVLPPWRLRARAAVSPARVTFVGSGSRIELGVSACEDATTYEAAVAAVVVSICAHLLR